MKKHEPLKKPKTVTELYDIVKETVLDELGLDTGKQIFGEKSHQHLIRSVNAPLVFSNTSFQALGADSLTGTGVEVALTKKFDVEFDRMESSKFSKGTATIGQITEMLATKLGIQMSENDRHIYGDSEAHKR